MGLPASAPLSDGGSSIPSNAEYMDDSQVSESTPIPINGKGGKKRGVDHKCESCSKIYRHPSCLIKHRWEHTPHWREASKFVLSKHQQVQLLEAAAILSHLSPKNSSLPEDRSLWPSFLSGGSLPKSDTPDGTTHSVSSSVPNNGNFHRTPSNGPRLHDYSIPTSSTGAGGITQLRPGLVGVPTGPNGGDTTAATAAGGGTTTKPVPVPQVNTTSHPSFRAYRSSTADSWSSSQFDGGNTPSSFIGSAPFPFAPNSASALSNSSQSRSPSGSASGSRSDDESLADIDIDIEVEAEAEAVDTDLDGVGSGGRGTRGGYSSTFAGRYGYGVKGRKVPIWKKEEEEMTIGFIPREEDEIAASKQAEWDGMEMEMDMD
ncbi:hypothetical protein H0H93_010448 [Arthromyces matolae]|nr:hypothetical protein H0H93_010448 [Arthromyces matolae]